MSELKSDYTPLLEKAVRRDGTIGIKIISPGWGSSGYYSPEVLQRDIPVAFPPGTHMMWNHDTPTEETERPEGDLSRLAAVLVSQPRWEEAGAEGAGMYADARVFSGYAESVDQIAEHIGVSIRGMGTQTTGTAEGKDGVLVGEITKGKSIDFVTAPGAGGRILQVFESAPGAAKLPDLVKLDEAANIGEWFESQLHMQFTIIADNSFGDGQLNREERIALSSAIGDALGTFRESLKASMPELYSRAIWDGAPTSADLETAESNRNKEQDIMTEELQEAQNQLKDAVATVADLTAENAKLQERLLLQEAAGFVAEALAKAELPDMTRDRLAKQLQVSPPIADGKIIEADYTTAIETAVTEAQAEIAAISGQTGRITGQGKAEPKGSAPTLEESMKRQQTALAELGYGGDK